MGAFALLSLSLWLLAWTAPDALAQQYPGGSGGHCWQVTYSSSGTSQMDYFDGMTGYIVPDSQSWADTAGESSAPANGAAGGQYAADASTSGSVTATLTWVPAQGQTAATDPPPANVIVKETAYAGASGGSVEDGKWDASDGLGDQPQNQWHSVVSQGTRCSLKNGSSGTITLPSVLLSASTPDYAYPYPGYATASVSYQVQACAVELILRGTTYDSNGKYNILVGQNCTAFLYLNNGPSDVSFGLPTWTIPSEAYTAFNISADQSTGAAVPFPDPASTDPLWAPKWFWKDGDIDGVVKTVQASAPITYTDSFGTVNQIGTVTAEKQVTVWNPPVWDDPEPPTVPLNTPNPVVGTALLGDGAVITQDQANGTFGFQFLAGVGLPQLFSDAGYGYGNFAWLQLCKINVTAGGTGTQMAEYQLDSAFPYNMNGGQGDVPGLAYDADSTPERVQYKLFADSPEEGWNDNDTALAFNNSYLLHLMYLPPDNGEGVNWVPLYSYSWGG